MRRFLKSLLLFFAPIAVLALLPGLILYRSHESLHGIDDVLKEPNYLIGYAYDESNYSYLKRQTILQDDPYDVWALGASRVLSFRDTMFTGRFYNAGYSVTRIKEFRAFLHSIPESKYPKCILVGLDQMMFNPAWDNLQTEPSEERWTSYKFFPQVNNLTTIYKDVFGHKIDVEDVLDYPAKAYGLNAILHNTGFYRDGSMHYGQQTQKLLADDSTANDYHFSNTFDRIAKGENRFEYAATINPAAVAELDSFLTFAQRHRIAIVAFLPPIADTVYRKMQATGKYGYLAQIDRAVRPVCLRHGAELYDYTTLASCHSNDAEAIDGFHGGEVTYLKLLIDMLERRSMLNRWCDLEKLKADLRRAPTRYQVY